MKENSSQQLHMLRYTLTEQLIHGMEVSNLAYDLARELGYEKEICYELAKAGVLHDIGKIVLENYVEEQDTLVVEEMRFVRTHSTLGYELLQGRGYSDFVNMSVRVIFAAILVFHFSLQIEALPFFLSCRMDWNACGGNTVAFEEILICKLANYKL